MKHLIVGTAGHVDHGKTALIRLLTGTDTDRLKEEKARGISIDIGFASLRYPEELTLGIIDVPGHERFLKNMLAGTGGIDMAMLVIAADEGIMPQTREHFEMLQCFGIKHGLVVLNKIDKVDSEWLTLMEEEIRTYLGKTFLGQAPICRVSAINGAGIAELKQALYLEAQKVSARDRQAPFRLWIDRAFNLKGQGLIVTGSVMSGSLQTGAGLILYPNGDQVKVRGIESHNQEIAEVGAGQRASLKLAGTGLAEVGRGMFLSEEGYCRTGSIWEAAVQWKQLYPSGTRIRLHIGTGEFIGRLSFRKKQEQSEGPTLVRLHLEHPIAGAFGDQGLLRRFSPQDLVGGVTLLTPLETGVRRRELLDQLTEASHKLDYQTVLLTLLLLRKSPVTEKEWQQSAGYLNRTNVKTTIDRLLKQGKAKKAGNYYLATETMEELQTAMKKEVEEYHRLHPSEPGISRETLRQKIKLPANIADWFLQYASENRWIVPRGEFVASTSHASRHGGSMGELRELLPDILPVNELTDITPQWLAEKINRPLEQIKPFFDQMVREKVFIRLTGVHVYSNTMQYIGSIIQRHFNSHETLSVGEIRDLLNTSRRMVIPVMEYCDANKYTIREGDARRPGPALKNFSE